MRNTLILFALMIGGLLWAAIGAAEPQPAATIIAAASTTAPERLLTRKEIIEAVRTNVPEWHEIRQGVAMAALSWDAGRLSGSDRMRLNPELGCAYWPIDDAQQLWQLLSDGEDAPTSPALYIPNSRKQVYLLGAGRGRIEPDTIQDWFDETDDVGDVRNNDVPRAVWEARSLLRPLQIWQGMNGGQAATAGQTYRDLHLAANPQVIGGFDALFDRAEFFRFSRPGLQYGLLLTLENRSWLWTVDKPVYNRPGEMAMALYKDDEALQLIDTMTREKHSPNGQVLDREEGAHAIGTLASLLADAQLPPLEWILSADALHFDNQIVAWENRARLTLRALGSSQLAYQDQNLAKNYGSWQGMVQTDYIQRGYSRTSMISNYSMSVFYAEPSSPAADSHFTIVAEPTGRRYKLRTFAICEDQTLRVATDHHLQYIPNTGNESFIGDDPCQWDPIVASLPY